MSVFATFPLFYSLKSEAPPLLILARESLLQLYGPAVVIVTAFSSARKARIFLLLLQKIPNPFSLLLSAGSGSNLSGDWNSNLAGCGLPVMGPVGTFQRGCHRNSESKRLIQCLIPGRRTLSIVPRNLFSSS